MWEYTYNYSNELYHHGVKGMKWGVRKKRIQKSVKKTVKKTVKQTAERIKKHDAKVKRRANTYGILSPALNTIGYKSRYGRRKLAANVLNSAANAYISGSDASYYKKRGVDFVRKASITGLSISQNIDTISYYRDQFTTYVELNERRKRRYR